MKSLSKLAWRTATIAVCALAISACGPTASAIHPTLAPSATQPAGDGGDLLQPEPVESFVPPTLGTPPPAGIAQQMTGFTQGDAYEVTAVTATADGFVAVGFAGTGQGYYGPHNGVVWRSADGLSWQREVDPALDNLDPTDVVTIGSDVYVFGYQASTCSDTDPECDSGQEGTVVLHSAAGGPWQPVVQTSDMVNAEIDGVRAWNDKLVAWGAAADENGTTTLWTSTDAKSWTPTANLAGIDPIDSLGVGGPGLVAFGSDYNEANDTLTLRVATSSDGLAFTAGTVPPVTNGSVTDLVAGPGGMAGIGYIDSDTDPAAGLAVVSSDGTNWSQTMAGDPMFENAQLSDIHASASEYVSVGSTADNSDLGEETGRVWVSADGKSWRSLGNFGGAYSQYGGSALGTTGLVVFTANQQDTDEESTDLMSTIYGWFIPTASLKP